MCINRRFSPESIAGSYKMMSFILEYLNINGATLVLVTILCISYYYLFRKSKAGHPPKAPEAAGGWPVIGHLHLLGGSDPPYITLGALGEKYGPLFSIRIGVHPVVVVSGWKLAKECFTTHDVIVTSRPKTTSGKILGYDYLNFAFAPYGPFWREIRKITASELFSSRRVELLKHIRVSQMQSSLKEVYRACTKRQDDSANARLLSLEMKQWIGDINMNVMLRTIAGKQYSGMSAEAKRCRKAFSEFFHLTAVFLVGDAVPFLKWLDLGGHGKAMKRTAKELDAILQQWLQEHRQTRHSAHASSESKTNQDFMDVMLSVFDGADLAGYNADTVIKATLTTILAGGTDTTTVTIIWALSLLLNHRHALKKAQDELDLHVGRERLVNESDFSNLVYLQAIVKETLRLYPAGPLSGMREFTEDCTVGGYHVPAGTRFILNLWKMHRDPSVWPDPLEFKPERFLTTHKDIDIKGQHFELLPFGGGRRACPGISFGLQITYLALASFLQAFEVTTPSNAPVDMDATFGVTNVKTNPLEVLVKPRLSPSSYQ